MRTPILQVIAAAALLIQAQMVPAQYVAVPFNKGATGPCTPPSYTNDWPIWNTLNTCGSPTPVACTNGAVFNTIFDIIGSVNLGPQNSPTYDTTNAINSQPVADVGSGAGFTIPGSGLGTLSGSFSFYWVGVFTSFASNEVLVGGLSGSGFEWRIDVTTDQQEILKQGVASIVHGTHTLSINTVYALGVEYNSSTGAYVMSIFSGGSTTSDGSGTASAQTFGGNTDRLNDSPAVSENFVGRTAEFGFLSGSMSNTGVATYVLCKYAH